MHPTEDNTSLHSDSEIQAETNTEPKKKEELDSSILEENEEENMEFNRNLLP